MECIGLIPCAGLGLRMRPLRYPKELIPIIFEADENSKFLRPKLSIEFSLEALRVAGIQNCYAIIPDWKPEIMRYLGDGAEFGLHMAYLHNSRAAGLAEAIQAATPWLRKKTTCLVLPDTQFYPTTAIATILNQMEDKNADVVLGIFPTSEPDQFAPVETNEKGWVIRIEEKPKKSIIYNTWGIAVWNSNFWNYLSQRTSTEMSGNSITTYFDRAASEGLKVFGHHFELGKYFDIGRYNALPLVTLNSNL